MDLAAYFGFIIDHHKLTVCMEDIQKMMTCRAAIIRQLPVDPKAPDWVRKGRYKSFIVMDPSAPAASQKNFHGVFANASLPFVRYQYAFGMANILTNGDASIAYPGERSDPDYKPEESAGEWIGRFGFAVTEVQKDLTFQAHVAAHEAGHGFSSMFLTESIKALPMRQDLLNFDGEKKQRLIGFLEKLFATSSSGMAKKHYRTIIELLKKPTPPIPSKLDIAKNLDTDFDDPTGYHKLANYLTNLVDDVVRRRGKLPQDHVQFIEESFPNSLKVSQFLSKFEGGSLLADHPEFIKRYKQDLRALLNPQSPDAPRIKGDGRIYFQHEGEELWVDQSHYLPTVFGAKMFEYITVDGVRYPAAQKIPPEVRAKFPKGHMFEVQTEFTGGQQVGGEHEPDNISADHMGMAREEAHAELIANVMMKDTSIYALKRFFPRTAEFCEIFLAEMEKRTSLQERQLGSQHPIFMSTGPYSIPYPQQGQSISIP